MDLIDFGDASPVAAEAVAQGDALGATVPGYSVAAELLNFDPMVAPPPVATAAKRGLDVPAAVAAAFSAELSGVPATPGHPSASSELAGAWHYKRDAGCTYLDFDSELEIREVEGGNLSFHETLPEVGEAFGLLVPKGDSFEVKLTTKDRGACGTVRLRFDGTSGTLQRCHRPDGAVAWSQELPAQRGLSRAQQQELMKLGVGEQASRYQGQKDLSEMTVAVAA